jgi:hypothetical protein
MNANLSTPGEIDKELFQRKVHRMRRLINREKKVIIGWTAKAGCSMSIKLFYKYIGILDEALQYSAWPHFYREEVYEKNNHISTDDLNNDDFLKIKFVRNPYARAISSYIHALKTGYIWNYVKQDNHDISFKQFLEMITNATKHIAIWDLHHSMQKEWDEDNFQYNEIIQIEELDKRLLEINTKYDIDFEVNDKILTNHHHIKKTDDIDYCVSYSLYSEIKDAIPNYKFFYNDELVEMVYNIYQLDFETYNYHKNDYPK